MSVICPACRTTSTFQLRLRWDAETRRGILRVGAWSCDSCGERIVGPVIIDPVEGEIPKPGSFRPLPAVSPAYPNNLPVDVAADAVEAHRSFGVAAWRACAAMARRSLQGMCLDRATPDLRLLDQIDWLEEQRLITPQMKDVAHLIGLGANAGAHPDEDGLSDVGQTEAKALLEFLDDFITQVYTIPDASRGTGDR